MEKDLIIINTKQEQDQGQEENKDLINIHEKVERTTRVQEASISSVLNRNGRHRSENHLQPSENRMLLLCAIKQVGTLTLSDHFIA